MSVGLGRVRHALGDGATEAQAKRVLDLLTRAGIVDNGELRLAGVREIAKLAGVTPAAVCQWKDLPAPLATIAAGRIWDARDVERYVQARYAK